MHARVPVGFQTAATVKDFTVAMTAIVVLVIPPTLANKWRHNDERVTWLEL